MNTRYETDVLAWANEQAALIRAGRFDQLDLKHIAEEIEDVGKSEQRELVSRMAVLFMHLLKWKFQGKRVAKSSCWNGQFLRAWCPLQLRWTHAHSRNSNAAGGSSARTLQ